MPPQQQRYAAAAFSAMSPVACRASDGAPREKAECCRGNSHAKPYKF